jgi:hypothetical protein
MRLDVENGMENAAYLNEDALPLPNLERGRTKHAKPSGKVRSE